jgi:hypothetical protein
MSKVAIIDEYSQADREHIHYLILWGYRDAGNAIESQVKVGCLPDEVAITGYIASAIERHLNSGTKGWCWMYEVFNEAPIPNDNPKGMTRNRIDLYIKFSYDRPRQKPKFVFEAKPLNSSKRHQRYPSEYIKDDALGRFIRGEYADYTANYPEAGMLGYVLSDTVEMWRDKLKKAIDEEKTRLRLRAPQRDVQIIDEFPFEWISEHDRDSAERPILIYHILLDCQLAND